VPRLCQFQFSDEVLCLEPAKASIGERWYCAEHYDVWIEYYRRDFARNGNEIAKQALKENR
jgi:hypothetical protein